ncbi:D-amino-acid transaminase [Desertibacillus haloalkaliphilus]|uniref:D-amino-acid transaminase n=1 Tax=Desertibacillus haloalkaliphilus TaxID=1328930 RepID=UPI001C26FF55|nr:D-amino-acid transaminase [Desertibacillus haloalkaliphilus]MBU8907709.1 D-amino-acid transaminase [Desertibacillus haloalkaliphilus]
MQYVLFNDQIVTRGEVTIDFEDRGYNFGDGIYEVISVYNQQPFLLTEHFERFFESAKKLDMAVPYQHETFYSLIRQLIEKNNVNCGLIYIQMTRGISPRNHLYERDPEITPIITGFSKEWPANGHAKKEGVHALTTEDIRWLRCDIKTINLLGNVLAKRKAADNQCYEAILHRGNDVTEGSSSNIFIIKDGVLYTHPATNLILNGITRQFVLSLVDELHIDVVLEPFTLEQLKNADEVFMTSTGNEVTPIISIEGTIQQTYPVGPVTRDLQRCFSESIEAL